MICAVHYFSHNKYELPKFKLKLLFNIEDLNNSIFDEVFNILTPQQQEQYIAFKASEQAITYRKERNLKLPYVDFNNLPEVFDDKLLKKIILYQEDGEVGGAIYDLLSEDHKGQIAQYNADPKPHFMGNVGEPDTVTSYIIKYGVNPYTRKPETIESFHQKYTIDPKTGDPIPKENNQ
ncbi:hypothetical protein [Chryseobacterium sp. BIGb0232]|uniref:hypothetical protein n=1 Tax=Chryseobacterium sp. BIGb0232 TaxID=2940598 RepID=UPI000F49560B|nr:hypothetical protein [Chryseobacterium sp. BIGb0232]MCS4301048.1 hypothetical protein [Chryseobacterium sp. BIGb0232]ROS20087.1 hypothetical protein EDF65_0789 [Chryseobacterium nakagawai]